MDAWKVYIEKLKKRPYSALGLLLLLTLPLTLAMVFRVQDVRTKAALPNALETEEGVFAGGVSKKSDTNASGGQYIEFNKNTADNPPFLTRPSSDPIKINGQDNVVIENVTIQGNSVNNPTGIGITISNVNGNITIRNVDLANLIGGIYIYNSTGTITIENLRSRNIGNVTEANKDIGSGHGNHIQIAESSLEGSIRNNKFLGGRTEDMVSTWHSGGRGVGRELIFENNQFQGLVNDTPTARAWDSRSGTGIIISDGGGSPKNGWIIIRNNTFLTPGQVGIQHIDGPGLQTYGNIVYGEKRTQNNNPITSWEGNPSGIVENNRYYWTNENNSQPDPWFHDGSSLTVRNNIKDPSINPKVLEIDLNIGTNAPAPTITPTTNNPKFLERTRSEPIYIDGQDNVLIENVSIYGDDPYNVLGDNAITIRNAQNITIRNVDIANARGGILIQLSSGTLLVENVRGRNIGRVTESNKDIGSAGGSYIQIAESQFEGSVRNNKFLGGQTQDMMSTWRSGGYEKGRELIFENNQLQGVLQDTSLIRRWQTRSGTGVIIGDGAGSPFNGNVIVRNNTFLNAGQSVIQHIDGPNIETYNNIILSEPYEFNNTPYGSWEGEPHAHIHDNRYIMWRDVAWPNVTGEYTIIGPWFYGGGVINEHDNVQDPNLNPADLVVELN